MYIGSACNLNKRWKDHRSSLVRRKHHSHYLQAAWDKYGEENFYFEVLEFVNDKNNLISREQFWLDYVYTSDRCIGYNISPIAGNCLGIKRSEKFRRKLSEAFKGEKNPNYGKPMLEEQKKKLFDVNKGKVVSEKTRHRLSEARKGKKHPNYGKHLSEETKQRISEANKGESHPNYGKHFSEETKQRISRALRGKVVSEETRQRLSEALKGENHPNYGKHLSEEVRKKMSEAQSPKRWEFLGKSQTLREWATEYGFDTDIINNRVNTHGWSLARALTTPIYKR